MRTVEQDISRTQRQFPTRQEAETVRTIESYRERTIEMLHYMLVRPAMFGRGQGLEILFKQVIGDLCWIDEREQEFTAARNDLQQREVSRSTGVTGELRACLEPYLGRGLPIEDGLSLIFGELAYRLGYVHLERVLTKAEWAGLRDWFDHELLIDDLRQSDVIRRFGEPSVRVGSGYWTHCYASEDTSEGWLCFEYATECRRWRDESGSHTEVLYGDDPILQSRRRTTGLFYEAMEPTPYGRMGSFHMEPLTTTKSGTAQAVDGCVSPTNGGEPVSLVQACARLRKACYERHLDGIAYPALHVADGVATRIEIYGIPPKKDDRHNWTLITSGMSDIPQTLPDGSRHRTELFMYVKEPRDWMFDVLVRLARYPFEHGTYLHWGHTVDNGGSVTREPSQLTAFAFWPPDLEVNFMDELALDEDPVRFLWCIPITEAERAYAERYGGLALEGRMRELNFGDVDESRGSIV